ncbi:exodeoxyribonuclease VII large subunit [Clostridium fallax]|uniref:Exodeoxyribonuclease 7 large subunit n=1 Tax=Clostridium fallax TaxID=1533 RepID=A0A1M4XMK5_9CLOT|nr:exodeoxyribonuclease VII large subunit [Clostridium fallax]SHE94626.1 Exodeoxyribonuclease VII large subunit [Clostridium fallax]SQB06348.1 exodeoxyribonuclease VII large subunit [Clostridium fallax]
MVIKTLTVSEINNYLKKIIDNDFILNNLSIKGEISNLKFHSSGHIYFSLKDKDSKINCIMFKSDAVNLSLDLENGMSVIAKCRLSIYIKDGSYQLYCREIEEDGLGDLHIQFERLKNQLYLEGLFEEEHKKDIPDFVNTVGVVTSQTGAAFQDIKRVIKRRNNFVNIFLYPAKVQGEGASKSIIDGIKYFNKNKNVDVIIIGRGGGAIEELWAFNDKDLAYEIFKSKIPIISAVGHEIDYTISDFVCDVRAATPSMAGELAVPKIDDIIKKLYDYFDILNQNIEFNIERNFYLLDNFKKTIEKHNPDKIIKGKMERAKELEKNLYNSILRKLKRETNHVKNLNELLKAYNPLNVLNKGYTVVKDEENTLINSIKKIDLEKEYKVIFKDGTLKCNFKTLR